MPHDFGILTPMILCRPQPAVVRSAQIVFGALLLAVCIQGRVPDYPLDDLYFVGPSLSINAHGSITNPYAVLQIHALGQDRFLAYPPLYFLCQALWAKTFGVSVLSICLYSLSICACVGVILQCLLKRFHLPPTAALLSAPLWLPALVFAVRPDPLAYGLGLLGVVGLTGQSLIRDCLGFVLLGMACITYPLAFTLCAPLVIVVLTGSQTSQVNYARACARSTIALCVGVITTLTTLMIVYEGRLVEFFRAVFHSRQIHHDSDRSVLQQIWLMTSFGYEWILTLPWIIFLLISPALIWWRYRVRGFPGSLAYIAIASGGLGSMLVYPLQGVRVGIVSASWIAASLILELRFAPIRNLAVVGFAAYCAFSQAQFFLRILFSKPPSAAEVADLKRMCNDHRDKTIRIDGAVARWCFDYRLPNHVTSLFYNYPTVSGTVPIIPQFASLRPTNEIWILSKATLIQARGFNGFTDLPDSAFQSHGVKLLGRTFNSVQAQTQFVVFR